MCPHCRKSLPRKLVWRTLFAGQTAHACPACRKRFRLTYAAKIRVGFLNVMQRNCATVTLANIAQMVNVIAPIMTNEKGLFLQTIYHPLKLYRDHCLGVALDAYVHSPLYSTRIFKELRLAGHDAPSEEVPYLDVSATADESGSALSLAVVNRNRDEAIETTIHLGGFQPKKKATVYELNGPTVDAENSFEKPDVVKPEQKEFAGAAEEFQYNFPPHSLTLMLLKQA